MRALRLLYCDLCFTPVPPALQQPNLLSDVLQRKLQTSVLVVPEQRDVLVRHWHSVFVSGFFPGPRGEVENR